MTKEKCIEVVKLYSKTLVDLRYKEEELVHCLTMLPQMLKFIEEDRMDKFFRWLGFVQGVMWCQGVYTIEQMKDHNRPK